LHTREEKVQKRGNEETRLRRGKEKMEGGGEGREKRARRKKKMGK